MRGQLSISSCSSTLILDSYEIPTLVEFKSNIRIDELMHPPPPIPPRYHNWTIDEEEALLSKGSDSKKRGIRPVKLLNDRSRFSRALKEPSIDGRDPWNKLPTLQAAAATNATWKFTGTNDYLLE
ncbi:hypothetical protein Tco_0478534 [Tanacetum coccineum]